MLTPHLSEANELLNEHWAKIVLSEKNSTSISTLIMFKKWMPLKLNAITCIDKRFAVKNSGISCLALIFYLSNPRMTILHAENRFKVAKHPWLYTVFFCKLIWTHGLVVKVSSKATHGLEVKVSSKAWRVWWHVFDSTRESLVRWVWFKQGAESLCSPSAIFHGTEPVSVLTHLLYIALFMYFCFWISPVAFSCW